MIPTRVHHISFGVSDLERSKRFYEDILGLEPIARPEMGLGGAWYRAGDSEVHLIAVPDGVDVGSNPEKVNPLANHQAFGIADYQQTLDLLKAKGVEVLETHPKLGQMWIGDPDGNVLELIARAS
jgi:catechol 2,3-dioxygenase-like lactoylglutathione lyase family enzyme